MRQRNSYNNPIKDKFESLYANRTIIAIMLIFVLGFSFRISKIGIGMNIDSGVWITDTWEMLNGKILYKDIGYGKTPLLIFLGAGVFKVTGNSIPALQFIMAVLTSSTIFACYLIGKELFGERVGLLAALFFALDPISVSWGAAFHISSVLPVFEAWAFYFFFLGLKRNKNPFFFISGIFAALAFLTKQMGAIIVPAFGVIALLHYFHRRGLITSSNQAKDRESFTRPMLSFLYIVLGFFLIAIPFILYFIYRDALSDAIYYIMGLNLAIRDTTGAYSELVLKSKFGYFVHTARGNLLLWFMASLSPLIVIRKKQTFYWYPLIWLASILSFMVLVSHKVNEHHLMECIPVLSVLAALSLVHLKDVLKDILAILRQESSQAIVDFVLLLFWLYAWFYAILKHNYRLTFFVSAVYVLAALFVWLGQRSSASGKRNEIILRNIDALLIVVLLVAPICGHYVFSIDFPHLRGYRHSQYSGITLKEEQMVGKYIQENTEATDRIWTMCDPIYSFLSQRETLPILVQSGIKTMPMGIIYSDWYRQLIDEQTERRTLLNPDSRLKYIIADKGHWRSMSESPEMGFVVQFIQENFSLEKQFKFPNREPHSYDQYSHLFLFRRKEKSSQ